MRISSRQAVLLLAALALPAPLVAQAATTAADPWAPLTWPRTHTPTPTTAAITAADLMTRLYAFSDDSMNGRVIASKGNYEGVEYVASQLKEFGVQPGGDGGTYFQVVPLVTRVLDSTSTISANGTTLDARTDFLSRDPGRTLRPINGAQVIFAGDWADAAHRLPASAAAGKFVVLVSSTQPEGNPPGVPRRDSVATYFADAAGVAVVALDGIPAPMAASYRTASGVGIPSMNPATAPSYLYITRHAAAVLLGAPLDGLHAGALGATVSGRLAYRDAEIKLPYPARNVIGIIPGSDPRLKGEYVAIGAHNDHIGTTSSGVGTDLHQPVAHDSEYVVNHLYRTSGLDDPAPKLTAAEQQNVNDILVKIRARTGGKSARVDSIFNGADDDGSGSVSVLEMAQYFAAAKVKPRRSMIFVWHVGEEEGLYGSEYFTDHPTVARDSIVAQLNIDMVGRGDAADITGMKKGMKEHIHGNPDYLQLVGSRRLSTELGDLAESVNMSGKHGLKFDYSLDANGHEQDIYCRSDHANYARFGIPIIFFTTGGHADYHQVTDEPQYIDYGHMARVDNFIADLALHVANLDHRPVVDKPKPDPYRACVQ
ncbi:MAG TPA: M28 family peptidase [Gemmatimonadales bacterium]|jgi:hypothetical protein|nr:M28 family peptidase [Gemmatimonadales bacterium]